MFNSLRLLISWDWSGGKNPDYFLVIYKTKQKQFQDYYLVRKKEEKDKL